MLEAPTSAIGRLDAKVIAGTISVRLVVIDEIFDNHHDYLSR
jgi:hypothetical protein